MPFFNDIAGNIDREVAEESRNHAFKQLRDLYRQFDEESGLLEGDCRECGECCRFTDFGHDLFITPVEGDYLLSSSVKPLNNHTPADSCPWQTAQQCQARECRTLGCRSFFCSDDAAGNIRQEFHEKYLAIVKLLNSDAGYSDCYAPLNTILESLSRFSHLG